jgi:hypothetical protein
VSILVAEIILNRLEPSCHLTLAPAWRTAAVASLATASYNERDLPSGHLDLARLAVLADAFEEVGCTDQQVLEHLRGPGRHVRGCFAVDAVLGRT